MTPKTPIEYPLQLNLTRQTYLIYRARMQHVFINSCFFHQSISITGATSHPLLVVWWSPTHSLLVLATTCWHIPIGQGQTKGSLRPCLPLCRQCLTKVLVSIRTMPFVKLITSQKISIVSNISCPSNIGVVARYFTKPLAHKQGRNTKLS